MHRVLPSCPKWLSALGAVVLLAALATGCSAASSDDPAKTITVGYTNTESSGNGLPEWHSGGQAAIDYLNAHGGINGATIKPVFCAVDGSPEASINCANKLIDAHVALDFVGVDVGIDSALPLLQGAGIPVVSAVGSSTQLTNPDSFVLIGGNGPDISALVKALKNAGSSKIVFVDFSGIGAGATQAFDIAKSAAPRLGMEVSELRIPVTNTDYTGAVASALGKKPDGFLLDLSETACTNFLQALKAANFTGTSDGPCSKYLTTLGDNAPPTVAVSAVWTPDLRQYAPKDVQPRLDIYADAMKASKHSDIVNSWGASRSFSGWMTLAQILGGINGPVTASSAKTALQTADLPGYLGPDVHCGKKVWPSEPAVCSAEELLVRIVPGPDGPKRELLGSGFADLSDLAS